MDMTMADQIHAGLISRIPGVVRADSGDRWLLVAETAGRTVEAWFEGDLVRLFAGRIAHALSSEDADEITHVIDVAEALHAGNATELFGYAIDGTFGFVGHEIRGLGNTDFFYERVDDGVRVMIRRPI